MYPYLKWIVCGVLVFVHPLIAVILFVGWMGIDIYVAIEHGKLLIAHEAANEKAAALACWEYSEYNGFFALDVKLSYPNMTMNVDSRCLEYCGEESPDEKQRGKEGIDYLVRRASDGKWESKEEYGSLNLSIRLFLQHAKERRPPWPHEDLAILVKTGLFSIKEDDWSFRSEKERWNALIKNDWTTIREDWSNSIETGYQKFLRS